MASTNERIIYLLRSYTSRAATKAEQQELMDWLAANEDDGSFQSHVRELLAGYPEGYKAEGVDWERIYSKILAAGRAEHVPMPRAAHRIHFLKTSWFRYAAAVVLLAGGAITYVISSDSEKSPSIASDNKQLTEIKPGGNKAVLTLADGSKIVLDNAQNGSLAQQGGTRIIKLTNGQLAYNASGDASRRMGDKLLYNTISTPPGGQYQIVLPDGTGVWLNAASTLRYPVAFSGSSREVELTGEVYLEVAKNSKQPFIVRANGTEIRVLGTSFNINAYENEDALKTTLVEGSVKVKAGAEEAILRPRQQAVVVSSDQQRTGLGSQLKIADNADIASVLAWKNGYFNFNGASLPGVMRQLTRWYNVEVVYEGTIQPKKFGGEIQRDMNLSEVLDILQQTGVHFRVEGRKIIVMP